jgi:molecular chaperone DnaJ
LFLPINALADSVNISVDLPIYTKSDTLTIYGSISSETSFQIIITDPDGEIVFDEEIIELAGDFSHNFIMGELELNRSGTYDISVTFNESIIENEFFYDSGHNVNPSDVTSGIESVSDSDLILVFSISIAILASVFVYLARHSIFRKKTVYDTGDWASKKNRDYEKYHSEWMSDEINFERKGKRKIDDEKFRELLQDGNLPNFYDVLQIQRNASQDDIKKQYRYLAKKWHPDRKHGLLAEKKMAEINKAYEVLSNPDNREMYDQYYFKN